MAQVDFSNAVIEPAGTKNPIGTVYVNLRNTSGYLRNASGTTIGSGSYSSLVSESKQYIIQYRGTFSASGTEFYVYSANDGKWRVSNITFNSGDTYEFMINATLTCN